MELSENHNIFESISTVNQISQPLVDDSSCINFLNYAIIYDDNTISVLTAQKDWAKHFYLKYHDNSNNHKKRLKSGINYWKRNRHQNISEIMEDARNNFDIDARIEFVYRDEITKCYHLFSFCSNRKNADRAYAFYGLHTTKLINFIACFNRTSQALIAEANKLENRISIPQYSPPNLPEKTRNFVAEMKAVGATYDLGDRETEVMILYAAGCSAKQIAEMFDRSLCTVETHITRIYKKTGCKDRKDLNIYVRNLGLTGMERFFFSYFSHE